MQSPHPTPTNATTATTGPVMAVERAPQTQEGRAQAGDHTDLDPSHPCLKTRLRPTQQVPCGP